ELKKAAPDLGPVLDGLQDNPLSASLEVRLHREAVETATVKKMREELKALNGVDSVYDGEKIAATITQIKNVAVSVGLGLFGLVGFGIGFVIYSSVKNLFYRKREDIEILKLLGASAGFIRLPFLMEGGTIGIAGGLLAFLAAYLCYTLLVSNFGIEFPMLKALVFPIELTIALPIVGLIFGIAGALVAIGRIRFS
ncbi:MAG TPA: FtsX-like permease family protein, partial [Dissulfurispiraceae bacterium]|nr:FtsX-like permease family protein [Dissulfurispiraceae bacterium]